MRRYSHSEEIMILRFMQYRQQGDGTPNWRACQRDLEEQLGHKPSYKKLKELWDQRDEYDLSNTPDTLSNARVQALSDAELGDRRKSVRDNYLDISEAGTEIMKAYLQDIKRRIAEGDMPSHKEMYQIATMSGIASDKHKQLAKEDQQSEQPKSPARNVFNVLNFQGESDDAVQDFINKLRERAAKDLDVEDVDAEQE